MTQPSRDAALTGKHVVLFLAAIDTGRRALDREVHAIHLELKPASQPPPGLAAHQRNADRLVLGAPLSARFALRFLF